MSKLDSKLEVSMGAPEMPFTGHNADHLAETLKSIVESGLAVEVFDAFLAKYKETGDLDKARFFAACEWDC